MPLIDDKRLPFTFAYPDNCRVIQIDDSGLPAFKVRDDTKPSDWFVHLTWEPTRRHFVPAGWTPARTVPIATPLGAIDGVITKPAFWILILCYPLLSAVLIGLLSFLRPVWLRFLVVAFVLLLIIYAFCMHRKALTAAFYYDGVQYVFTFGGFTVERAATFFQTIQFHK